MTARIAGRVRACHEMPMFQVGQDDFLLSYPLGGGAPSFDGRLNLDSPTGVLADMPKRTDCTGSRRIEVLKSQG